MIKKLESYLDYILKVNKIDDLELKDEITSNLIDKYNDYIKKGMDEDKAYIETIKTIGDFNIEEEVIDQKFEYKPNWANISLWVSLGLAILATIALLLSTPTSIFLVAISVSLHIGASYYLYHLSQYVMKEEKDVLKHNNLLKTIFTNLKTTFIFWNINISFWIAKILSTITIPIIIYYQGEVKEFSQIISMIVLGIIFFIMIFAVLLLVFNMVYKKLENKYLELTNEVSLDNLLKNNKIIQVKEGTWVHNILSFLKTLDYVSISILLLGIFIMFQSNYASIEMPSGVTIHTSTIMFEINFSKNIYFYISLVSLVVSFGINILANIKRKKGRLLGIISLGLFFVSYFLIINYFNSLTQTNAGNSLTTSISPFTVIIGIFTFIYLGILIYLHVRSVKIKKRLEILDGDSDE